MDNGYLTPDDMQAKAAEGYALQEKQKRLLNQMQMAEELQKHGMQPQQHSTGAGGALGALGSIGSTLGGVLQQKRVGDAQAQTAGQQGPIYAQLAAQQQAQQMDQFKALLQAMQAKEQMRQQQPEIPYYLQKPEPGSY